MSARSKLSFTEVGAVFVTLATITLEAEGLQVVQTVRAPSASRHYMIDVKRFILGGSSTKQAAPVSGQDLIPQAVGNWVIVNHPVIPNFDPSLGNKLLNKGIAFETNQCFFLDR